MKNVIWLTYLFLFFLFNVTLAQGTLGVEDITKKLITKNSLQRDNTVQKKMNNKLTSIPLSGDLELLAIALSLDPVTMNDIETITTTIQNIGNSGVNNREIDYYLSYDNAITTDDFYIGTDYITLASGSTENVVMSFVPQNVNGINPGDFYVGIIIPYENEHWYRLDPLTIIPVGLAVPEMILPLNNATNVPIIPKYTIGTVPMANQYELQLSFDQSFYNVIESSYWQFDAPPTSNTLDWFTGVSSVANFLNNRNYYWRVRALDTYSSAESPWSQPFKYTTAQSGPSINSPSLISPLNYAIIPWIDVNLQWNQNLAANWYQVQWSLSSSFNGFSYQWSSMANPSHIANVKPVTDYFWRVVSFNNNSISQFSLNRSFTTGSQVTLTQKDYTISDGSGMDDYESNLDLFWLLKPTNGIRIQLSFSSFDTETDFDFVTVYDGQTTNSPILGRFSGHSLPPTLTSSTGKMLIVFTTDNNITDAGWSANYSSTVTSIGDENSKTTPKEFILTQNFPNPFNPSTTISYSLPKEGNVKLCIYDALGSKVATIVDENKSAGNYSVEFNGSKFTSGIYLYRLESGNYTNTKKFILMK